MNEVSHDTARLDAVRDLGETLAAQQLAGPEATEDLARSFLVRLQRDIDEQVDLRLRQQLATGRAPARLAPQERVQYMLGLVLGSLGIGVPLTVAAGFFGGAGLIVVLWACVVLLNLVGVWFISRS